MKKTYFYLISLDFFERNTPKETIKLAYENDDYPEGCPPIVKLEPHELAEKINDDMLDDQEYWVVAIEEYDMNHEISHIEINNIRKALIQEIKALIAKTGEDSLTLQYGEHPEEEIYMTWYDKYGIGIESRIDKVVNLENEIQFVLNLDSHEEVYAFTSCDFYAQNVDTLCAVKDKISCQIKNRNN